MAEGDEARQLLVDMLHEAARLEHCLLNSYLYTACSLKSMPQEFASEGADENRRRAIQFERVRAWKQSILQVAQEEMLHLHYVQCLIRALGESPYFQLPDRDEAGNWFIPNWKMGVGKEGGEPKGVHVPIGPLNQEKIRRFVLYEATDSLQDENPFEGKNKDLFENLQRFELDLHFESILFHIDDAQHRAVLKEKLHHLYTALTPRQRAAEVAALALPKGLGVRQLPPLDELKFQSIADFYYEGILPLYEEAFHFGWVKYSDRDLENEQLNPNYAAEGFLPVGPVQRSNRFARFSQKNISDPLRHYKNVRNIVEEIVAEGEGTTRFEARSAALLKKIEELGGSRGYLEALVMNQSSRSAPAPDWLDAGERLRQSHLYRFAMIMVQLGQESLLAQESNVDFEAARRPLDPQGHPALRKLADELPAYFNACYLALVAWLSRMYEIQEWRADAPRRMAIEMLATWPLMSLAIRPFLELASFLPVKLDRMFRWDGDSLPALPIHTTQLKLLYESSSRSEKINEEMDFLAVRVLSDTAAWARSQQDAVGSADLPGGVKEMMLTRLGGLGQLDEFQRQFPFRVHGGYSDRMPDTTYQQTHPDGTKYQEDPSALSPLFNATLALRLRFAGWGLVQLSTDPDPPTDEAGCTGTHMLHAADGDRRFDRALVWQRFDPDHTILREPRENLPPLGVNCREVCLLAASGQANAGYVPLQVMQSTGAVQTSGVQQDLRIQGFNEVLSLNPGDILGDNHIIRMYLREKNGVKPFLNGANHLVWQDGEPIDPFILSTWVDRSSNGDEPHKPELLFQREIFNDGLSLLEMSPLQRLLSARGPCGFDADLSHIPAWAMSDSERQSVFDNQFPLSYLKRRAKLLAEFLSGLLKTDSETIGNVDQIVSVAERMLLVSVPRRTTVAWLRILLHYGHTLSGNVDVGASPNPILTAIAEGTGLQLGLTQMDDRNKPNARWLVSYTKGVMDTDALSDFVFGELYIPLNVSASDKPICFHKRWSLPANLKSALAEYACQFAKPFWAQFVVQGDSRSLTLPDGTTITETLQKPVTPDSYTYTMTGIKNLASYSGAFAVQVVDDLAQLEWKVIFDSRSPDAIVKILGLNADAAEEMSKRMQEHFRPRG